MEIDLEYYPLHGKQDPIVQLSEVPTKNDIDAIMIEATKYFGKNEMSVKLSDDSEITIPLIRYVWGYGNHAALLQFNGIRIRRVCSNCKYSNNGFYDSSRYICNDCVEFGDNKNFKLTEE